VIAIILVNWNGYRDTIECLESLLRQNAGDFVALVIDNGSEDGSVDSLLAWGAEVDPPRPDGPPWDRLPIARVRPARMIRRRQHEGIADVAAGSIVIVETGANHGFAGANNIGMEMARRDPRVTHFWLLNNDTAVEPACADRLIAASVAEPRVAIVGARLMFHHSPDVVQGVGVHFNPWTSSAEAIGLGASPTTLPTLSEIERSMSYVMGATMFLPVATYDAIGPMEEAYFLYFEELDWALRLARAGAGRQTVALDAVVYHKEGASIGTSMLKRSSEKSLFYMNRNLVLYTRKLGVVFAAIAVVRILFRIPVYFIRYDASAAKSVARALVAALSGRKGP